MHLHRLIENAKYHAKRIREAMEARGVKQKLAEAVELAEQFPSGEALVDAVENEANKANNVLGKLENAIKLAERAIKAGKVLLEDPDHFVPRRDPDGNALGKSEVTKH